MINLNKVNNLLELFIRQYERQKSKKNIFLTSLSSQKKNYSWQNVYDAVAIISTQIRNYVKKGDRCLLISENRPEWLISDLSIMLTGAITVPAYTTYSEKDYDYIIDDCEPSIIFVSNNDQFKKIQNLIKRKKFIKKIFSFEKIENTSEIECQNINDISPHKINKINLPREEIGRKDPACIIYTSGTQGNPKGVILSHGGILSNCEGAIELLKPIIKNENTRFLTWLPLSHSYEHTVQFVQISVSAQVFYAESIEKLIKNMNECKPEIMTAVPRFYQNLFQKINSNFTKTKGIKKALINKMLILGLKKIKQHKLNIFERYQDKVLDKIVRKKIKDQFGGSLKSFVSGGGALDKNVGFFLNAIGLPTLQGYGLTEASPVVSCNPIDDIRVDTVGPPFKGNEVKLASDGEILVKGENVMLGYWNNKEETEKVIKDGWLYTGDIGVFKNNYLKITDRKKDIIITPGGDNISPAKIENELTNSKLIDQAIVYGDNKPYLVAILIINEDHKSKTNSEITEEVNNINKKLTKIENIKKFLLIEEKFSIENGMLTPTLKLKRFKIINRFKNLLDRLY